MVIKKMSKIKIFGLLVLSIMVIVFSWVNVKYKVIAFHIYNISGERQFRVLTWNICGSNIEDKEKQEKIARLIIAQNADFVQLNEFGINYFKVIDSIVSACYPYKEYIGAQVQAGDVLYSKNPFVGSGLSDIDIPQTIFVKARIEKDSLCLVGCHLVGNNREGKIEIDDADSLGKVKKFWHYYRNAQEKRKEHLHFLKNAVQEKSLPMIVMGDMNDFNHSAPMDSLRDAGMKNAWWEGGFGYGATYHEGWLRLRIDHIYYNERLCLKNVKVVNTDLSDHNILIADFAFNN